jgi:membrane protein implicated in regulation of membrane protease activity
MIEGELWRAVSDKDLIKPGEKIIVIDKRDFLLIVRKM